MRASNSPSTPSTPPAVRLCNSVLLTSVPILDHNFGRVAHAQHIKDEHPRPLSPEFARSIFTHHSFHLTSLFPALTPSLFIMRFTAALFAAMFVSAVSAAAVDTRDVSGDITAGAGAVTGFAGGIIGGFGKPLTCTCFQDSLKETGAHIAQDATSYTCAYASGSCQWMLVSRLILYDRRAEADGIRVQVGTLVNKQQPNCQKFAPCL
jgi:hypothetical protein